MDIGTGKIEKDFSGAISNSKFQISKEGEVFISEGIRHYMIDIVDPQETFSAAQFKEMADEIIADILHRGKLPILCGGTGFWIKSIVDNITYPEVKPDWQLREELGKKSVEELFSQLQTIDPKRAKNIDAKNPARLIRALEICAILGQVPKEKSQPQYEALQIGVSVPKEILHTKIKKRLDSRWRDGMLAETEKLHQQDLSWEKIQSFGLGYFWMPQYLQKKITLEELYERVYLAEKDYAKRQMTWFAKDKRIIWLEKYVDIQKEVEKFIN
jgi:tRNA dimethylallyltransferase